jgi:ribonuclease P protein component
MLATAHRLRRHGEFATAIRAGQRAGRATLVVHLRAGDGTGPPRAGFVVSRAVGGAVVRNRVRRRLRHLVREHLSNLPTGTLLVVRALPASASAPYPRLADDLASALRTAVRRTKATR